MSIQQKILQTQGLTDYETYIVDSLPTSKYFKVFSKNLELSTDNYIIINLEKGVLNETIKFCK